MNRKTAILTIISLTTGHFIYAQGNRDTMLKGNTIEIIQSYRPVVKKAPKPDWMPQLPAADTFRPLLSLDVPQQTLYYSYTSGQLKPLALGKDSVPDAFPNYIKAGAGNLATLFLDAGIGSLKGKDWSSNLRLHHLSQKGSLIGQQTALSGLETEVNFNTDGLGVIHTNLSAERSQYYYYGYLRDAYNYNADSLKQVYSNVSVSAFSSKVFQVNGKNTLITPEVNAGYFGSRPGNSEYSFGFTLPITYPIDTYLDAHIELNTSINSVKWNGNNLANNFLSLTPGLNIHKNNLAGHGYLGFALGRSGNFYVLPDVEAEYGIPSTHLSITGGWHSFVRQNTYKQLAVENPFINNGQLGIQSRNDELYAALNGSTGDHITWKVKAAWLNYQNLAVYLNNQDSALRQYMFVLYDKVSALSLSAAGRYTQAQNLSAGLDVSYYNYYQGTQKLAWHQPEIQLKGDITVQPMEKLWLSGYVFYLDGIHSIDSKGFVISHGPVFDLGIGANYAILNRLNLFLQINNVLNSKYERWQGYQAYGINIYGGLQLKF